MLPHNSLPAEFRPMLSAAIKNEKDFKKLRRWPYLVSPKLDGIRIFIDPNQGAVTRTMKPIRNRSLRAQFLQLLTEIPEFGGLDGEIIFGAPNACSPLSSPLSSLSSPSVFQDTTSAVMSYDGHPEVTFWVFDAYPTSLHALHPYNLKPSSTYIERQKLLDCIINKVASLSHTQLPNMPNMPSIHIKLLEHVSVESLDELLKYEEIYLQHGFEGLMLRDPNKPYRYGRSSLHEQQQHLIKLKRFADEEAIIVGFEELQTNLNPDIKDDFGLAKRSSSKENLKPANTLGALNVKCLTGDFQNREFSIGSGFDQALRDTIWRHRDTYFGKTITFKYQTQGSKDLPRFPVFKGFREDF